MVFIWYAANPTQIESRDQKIFMGSGIKIYNNFGIRDQNLRSKCGIRQEKIYVVATLSGPCSWDNASESAYPFSPAFDISEEFCISINWLILSIFCIKKFPKPLARSSGAISFGNDTSDGSHSSDLVVPTIRASYPHKTGLLLVDLPAQFSIYFSVKTR